MKPRTAPPRSKCTRHYVPDIVITDWAMPIFDGLELAQMIRQPESKGNPLRADHHADRPFREAARHGGARRRRDRIPRQADLGQGALSAHPQRRRQSRARSSRPRPISARTAGATPAPPISAPSAASAARRKCCSSRRCSTRPVPPSSADELQGNHHGERTSRRHRGQGLRRPSRHHPAQPAAQGVAAGRGKGSRTIRSRAPNRRSPGFRASSRTGCRSRPTGSRPPTPPSSRTASPKANARRAVSRRPRHQGRCRDLRLSFRRRGRRQPVPDHRARARSRARCRPN